MPDQQRHTSDERAALVAYLDGELPAERSQVLADKLTRSLSGRREVEMLKTTWELLDFLSRPEVDDSFTARTITLVSGRPEGDDRLVGAAREIVRRFALLSAVIAMFAVSSLIGYASARWAWPDPTARLARELTIAERFHDYRAVGSFEFLRRLDESSLFKEASD